MLFLENSHSYGNSGTKWRQIFPGESCLSMLRSTVWLDALENPNCTALLCLSRVGWTPNRSWPPPTHQRLLTAFLKGITEDPSWLSASSWDSSFGHSILLSLSCQLSLKEILRKESMVPNQPQESSHIFATLLIDGIVFNILKNLTIL